MKKNKDILKECRVKVLECDVPTRTGRIYSKEVIEKAIDENIVLKEELENKAFFGTFVEDVTEDNSIDLSNVAFSVESLSFDKNDLNADIKVLNTPRGRVMKEFFDRGVGVTFSCRGTGEVDSDGKVIDYQLNRIVASIATNEEN